MWAPTHDTHNEMEHIIERFNTLFVKCFSTLTTSLEKLEELKGTQDKALKKTLARTIQSATEDMMFFIDTLDNIYELVPPTEWMPKDVAKVTEIQELINEIRIMIAKKYETQRKALSDVPTAIS